MSSNTITDIVVPIVCALSGVILGFIFRILWERRINKVIKYDEIILNNEIDTLKEKLDIYWSIYFKLLICLSAKLQIKKIKESSNELINMIQMENDVIIKNLEDIISLITKNTQTMDMDDYLLDLILRFISHVLAYKCLRQLNIKKLPSEYGFPFPDEFTHEITRRTLLIQSKYEEYLGNKYDSEKFNGINYLNISLNHSETKNSESLDLNNSVFKKNKVDLEFKRRLRDINMKANIIMRDINNINNINNTNNINNKQNTEQIQKQTMKSNNKSNNYVYQEIEDEEDDEDNYYLECKPEDIRLEDVFVISNKSNNQNNSEKENKTVNIQPKPEDYDIESGLNKSTTNDLTTNDLTNIFNIESNKSITNKKKLISTSESNHIELDIGLNDDSNLQIGNYEFGSYNIDSNPIKKIQDIFIE